MEQHLLEYLENAHKRSSCHKTELLQSDVCGCFYCLKVFKPTDISEWTKAYDFEEQTAFCPFCRIDSVIGDKSGFPVSDKNFLNTMHTYYFNFSPDSDNN